MKIKSLVGVSLVLFGLVSCDVTTVSKFDLRFNPILGKEIHVKRPLYLYEISRDLTGDSSRFTISSAEYGPEKVVAVLRPGHPVLFEGVRTSRGLGKYSQALVGFTEFESKCYPISYYIGMGGDDWKTGFDNNFISPLFDGGQ